MTQISRPFQIGLLVVVLFAAVFLFAFHGHSSTPTAPAPAPPATRTVVVKAAPANPNGGSSGSEAEQAALSHHVYNGSAPGVGGLSHAIAKAHGAVALSQQNSAQLAQKSAQASTVTPATPATAAPSTTHVSATSTVVTKSASGTTTKTATVHATVKHHPASGAAKSTNGPAAQRAVESELKQGKIVLLLFWNPKGTDDQVVHHQLKLMLALHRNATTAKAEALRHAGKFFGRNFDKSIAVHETLGATVGAFGSITRGVQVYGTPTLLVINPKGETIADTGVIDAYGIEQSIFEAHHG